MRKKLKNDQAILNYIIVASMDNVTQFPMLKAPPIMEKRFCLTILAESYENQNAYSWK